MRPTGRRLIQTTNVRLEPSAAATVHVTAIGCELAKRGWDVRLLAPRRGRRRGGYEPATYLPVPGAFPSAAFEPLAAAWLVARCLRERPDVIYTRHAPIHVAPAIASSLTGTPLVLEVNGRTLEEAEQRDVHFASRLLLRTGLLARLERFSLRHAARTVAVSAGVADYLERSYRVDRSRVRVVANGVDVDRFRPVDPAAARHALGLPPDGPYVGWIGGLRPWQGVDSIVNAADILRDHDPPVRFVIVGEGEVRAGLEGFVHERHLDDRVRFVGAVEQARVPTYIGACDLCIHYPVKARAGGSSPLKVYEYLASGRAVLAADVVGFREEFGDHIAYCPPEDPQALARAIRDLLDTPDRLAHLAGGGPPFVRAGHSWASVAGATDEVLSEAAGLPSPDRARRRVGSRPSAS